MGKKLCQCLGLASLLLVIGYGELLGGGTDVRLHYPQPLTAICFAHIADILLLTLGLFAVLVPLQRTGFYRWIRLLLAMLIPPYLMMRIAPVLPFDLMDGLIPILSILWAAALLLLLLRFPRWFRSTMRVASAVAACFALFGLSSIAQLLWVARWKPGPHERTAAWESPSQPPRRHPVLVWILFDELSYDQLFEHRAHDLQLPAFDSLRSESTTYTNVQPVGYKTAKVVPSLFSGHPVDDFRFSFDNRFKVHYADAPGWHPLTGAETIFGDAQKNGWRTAAVGWYNPYCTVYGDAIDQCFFANRDKLDGPMVLGRSFLRNTFLPFKQLGREMRSEVKAGRDLCNLDVRQRLQTHLEIEDHALQVLHTDQADLVFLHFAVPHSPNIWSRIDNDYAQGCDSSYLDSLALADRELGRILEILRGSPRWSDTSVIVQGDHSWRLELWNELPAWTDEDDAASHGVFDPRPAVLIHQAGQTHSEIETGAWPLTHVHEVVEQTLREHEIGGNPH